MEIREVDRADETLTHRHWEIGHAAEAHRPYDFSPTWEQARAGLRDPGEEIEVRLFGAFADGQMWSAGRLVLQRLDNLHLATVSCQTHPDRARRGLGSALLDALLEEARTQGRRVATSEAYAPVGETSPGLEFAARHGFAAALEEGMKVVDLVETEPGWTALEREVAPRHAGYRLLTWRNHVPEELLEGYCRLNQIFVNEAPMGDLDIEEEVWDEARVHSREQRLAVLHRNDFGAAAVAPDGEVAGFTEVSVSEFAPQRGIQSGTLVDPAYRGHGLGLAIKLANHRQLRRAAPECRVLLTGNADVNAAMNAVNDRLGYRTVERCVELQRSL